MASTTVATPMLLLQGRIPITVFRVVTVVTFVLALLIVTCRFIVLIPQKKRLGLGLDDILLIFATIFLIVGTIIVLIGLDHVYFIQSLTLNGLAAMGNTDMADLMKKVIFFQRTNWAYLSIAWASIFFAKFSFLTFFSNLCDRLPRMELYRKIVYGLSVAIFLYTIVDTFLPCPHLGSDALQCSNPETMKKNLALGGIPNSLGILTDIMILVIPISLLWKVKLGIYQKITIGIFLCLNVVMVILAIIRVAGLFYYGSTDITWNLFWQQLEASAAVTMISLVAFRSVFTSGVSKSPKVSHWKASIPRFPKRVKSTSSSNQDMGLHDVSVPSAAMIGTCTVIGSIENDVASLEESVTDSTVYDDESVRLPFAP